MKRFLKITGLLLGITVLLIAGVLTYVLVVVDPNDYKPQITELVKERTGRDLSIAGDIRLTYFPWLGFELGAVELPASTLTAPMTYMHEGRQYIVMAVGGGGMAGSLVALALPE